MLHLLLVRRQSGLTGVCNALNARTLAAGRTAHPIADGRGVQIEFSQRAAERVAVHAEFFGSFALIALVVREDLEDVALLELANSIRIGNSGAVHLRDEAVHFALQDSVLASGSRFGMHTHCRSIRAV